VRRPRGLSLLEITVAMFLMALAVGTVAYIFTGAVSDVRRSRRLTQAAFLAQTVMETALLVEPVQEVPEPTPAGPAYEGMTYRVAVNPWPTDVSFDEIQVAVYDPGLSPGTPLAWVACLRQRGGEY